MMPAVSFLHAGRPALPVLRPAVLALLYTAIAMPVLWNYIPWTAASFVTAIAALLLMLRTGAPVAGGGPVRWGWWAGLFAAVYLVLPVKTCLYVALCCALLAVWERRQGSTGPLPPLTLLLGAPVTTYFADVFSFPLRLQLTAWAGTVLRAGSGEATTGTAGAIIRYAHTEYSVDPACAGLHMLTTSLACCVGLVAVAQRRLGKRLALGWVVLLLGAALVLNIGANLVRILVLVYFDVAPDALMHDVTGLLCFGVYVLLPLAWSVWWTVRRAGKDQAGAAPVAGRKRWPLPHSILMPLLTAGVSVVLLRDPPPAQAGAVSAVPGYTAQAYAPGIVQLESPQALVYLKTVQGFFFTDHNPLLCWTGSGYVFDALREEQWAGVPVFTGTLRRDTERLYTAWWYDDGRGYRTVSQTAWRWRAARTGGTFTIVNVTAADEEALRGEVAKVSAWMK